MNIAPVPHNVAPARQVSAQALIGQVMAARGRLASADEAEIQAIRGDLASLAATSARLAQALADREERGARTPARNLAILYRELALAYDSLDAAVATFGWRPVDVWGSSR